MKNVRMIDYKKRLVYIDIYVINNSKYPVFRYLFTNKMTHCNFIYKCYTKIIV